MEQARCQLVRRGVVARLRLGRQRGKRQAGRRNPAVAERIVVKCCDQRPRCARYRGRRASRTNPQGGPRPYLAVSHHPRRTAISDRPLPPEMYIPNTVFAPFRRLPPIPHIENLHFSDHKILCLSPIYTTCCGRRRILSAAAHRALSTYQRWAGSHLVQRPPRSGVN